VRVELRRDAARRLPDRLPWAGSWSEVLNTDAAEYFGSGVGNLGGVEASGDGWHGQPASATLRVPPLATVWLHSRARKTDMTMRQLLSLSREYSSGVVGGRHRGPIDYPRDPWASTPAESL
jgi:hypothetical protein